MIYQSLFIVFVAGSIGRLIVEDTEYKLYLILLVLLSCTYWAVVWTITLLAGVVL